MKKLSPLLVLALLFHLGPSKARVMAASPAPKLAVIALEPAFEPLADLLVAQWSQSGDITLLERSELKRLLSEQAIATGQSRDYVKLGQLLGADGLVLLEAVNQNTNRFLAVRLLSVGPGVVLDISGHKHPIADLETWSERQAMRLRTLFPKLAIKRENAIPISILNLRSSLASPETAELERQLTSLIAYRLIQQPEFFVLERQRMDFLGWEKELSGVDESAFWTGSFMLDGIIDKHAINQETLSVSARLVQSRDNKKMAIEISGPRWDHVGIVEQLVAKIREHTLKQSAWPAWDAAREAEKFYQEAQWSKRWGSLSGMQQAADAAWVLGRKNVEVATLRVDAYRLAADSQPGAIWSSERKVLEGLPRRDHLLNALRSISIYTDASRFFTARKINVDKEWYGLGGDTLETASLLLEHFRHVLRAQRGLENEVSELQGLCRELAQFLEAHDLSGPTIKMPYGGDLVPFKKRLALQRFRYGCYWFPKVTEAGAYIKAQILSENYTLVRNEVMDDAGYRFRNWDPAERLAAREVWRQLVDGLCKSENVRLQCEGELFQLRDLVTGDRESKVKTSFSFVDRVPDPYLASKLRHGTDAIFKTIWDPATQSYTTNVNSSLVSTVEDMILRKCQIDKKLPVMEQLLQEQKTRVYGRYKHNLQTAVEHQSMLIAYVYLEQKHPELKLTRERARELLPFMHDYELRFPKGDWVDSTADRFEDKAEWSFQELLAWLETTSPYTERKFHNLIEKRRYSETEADQLRPLLESYQEKVPAAARSSQIMIAVRLQTPKAAAEAVQKQTAAKQKALNHEVDLMKKLLAAEADPPPQDVLRLAMADLTTNQREELLQIIRTRNRTNGPSLKAVQRLEESLVSNLYTYAQVEQHLRTARSYNYPLLRQLLLIRKFTADEARQVAPLWSSYKARMGPQSEFELLDKKLTREAGQ